MDATRCVLGLLFLTLPFVLLSSQVVFDDPTNFVCPYEDNPTHEDGKLVHNVTRTPKCFNGKHMAGCCVHRIYCNFNTSHIDLTPYGRPGFRMPCSDIQDHNNIVLTVCCPLNYILRIPLPKNTTDDNSSSDSSMGANDNTVDSDSDEHK